VIINLTTVTISQQNYKTIKGTAQL